MKRVILISKFCGIIFFNFENKKPTRIYDYLYCLPYITLYIILRIYYLFTTIPSNINVPYWLDVMEDCMKCTVVFIQFSLPIYYFAYRDKLKQLLLKMNAKFSLIDVRFNRPIYYWVLSVIVNLITGFQEKSFLYTIIFAVPLYIFLIQQYFMHKIFCIFYSELKFIHNSFEELDVTQNTENIVNLKNSFNKFRDILELGRELSDYFGFPILLNLGCAFNLFIIAFNYIQYNLRETKYIEVLNMSEATGWLTFLLFNWFYTVNCWNVLKEEVCMDCNYVCAMIFGDYLQEISHSKFYFKFLCHCASYGAV